jgi:hypothetical protein
LSTWVTIVSYNTCTKSISVILIIIFFPKTNSVMTRDDNLKYVWKTFLV